MKIKILMMFLLFTIIGFSQVRDSIIYIPGDIVYKDTVVYLPGEIIYQDTIINQIVDSTFNTCKDDTIRLVYIKLPPTVNYNYIYTQLPPTIEYNYIYNYIPSDTVCNPVILDSNYVPPTVKYSVTIQSTTNGTTNPSTGNYLYDKGTSITFNAIPNLGYEFDYWIINGQVAMTNPITRTINSDLTIGAYFKLILQPPLSEQGYFINPNGSGTYPFDTMEKGAKSFTQFANAGGWSLLNNGGKTLYVAKGIYKEQVNINTYGSTNKYVTIRNSQQQNYKGQVLIDGEGTRSSCIVIEQGCENSQIGNWLYIKGIDMTNSRDYALYLHCNFNNIVIDSCKITESGLASIHAIGNDDLSLTEGGVSGEDLTIKNCFIESKYNNPQKEDNCIYVQQVAGLNILNNYIHQQNRQLGVPAGSHAHVDCIQTHIVRDVKIANNICIIDSSVLGHGMILGIQSRPNKLDTVIIYNNYIYAGGHLNANGNPYVNAMVLRWYGYSNSIYPPTYVINNTIVTSNGGENVILQEYAGEFYNNVICQLGTNGQNPSNFGGYPLEAFASSWNGDKTYINKCLGNLMWNEWTNNMTFGGNQWINTSGATVSLSNWSSWISNGGTGVNSNPQFVNNYRTKYGYILKSNSLAKNIGVDKKAFIESKGLKWTDIEGKPRDLTPDAGCFEIPAYTGNSFYVWKNATGLNNGTSWTNAWKTFSAINWSLIQPGDALYISGGTDSITYSETLIPNLKGTADKWCLITNGSHSPYPNGHSGKVIIDGKNQTETGILLRNGGSKKPSYIKIKDLTIKNAYRGVDANFDEAHDGIALDGLIILNHAERGIIFESLLSFNVDSIFIENCKIISDNMSSAESDGIFFKGIHRGFIHNNYIRVLNQDPVQHVDALQSYLCNGFVITNNILINDSVYSQEGGGIPIILGSQGSNPVIIYNNFVYMGGVWMPGANWGGTLMTRWYDESTKPPTWILNNTVISNGPRVRGVWLEYSNATTTNVINNLIAQYSTTTNTVLSTFDNSTGSNLRVDSIRNNLYYRSWDGDVGFAGNLTGNGRTGTPSGWTDFVNNYGGTGVKGDPLLVKKIGYISNQSLINGELQSNSPAIDKGENIKWLLDRLNSTYKLNGRLKWENIKGILRDNTPNIGAY